VVVSELSNGSAKLSHMKVFISWSGPRGMLLADALNDWIHNVIQTVDCFYSSEDIRAGQRWNSEINMKLAETHFGVLCVTPENITSPWLNFEAGALAKTLADESRVVPVTLGFAPSALEDPLRQFNGVEATKSGVLKLVISIAEVAKTTIDVERTFELWWPELEQKIAAIPETGETAALPQPPGESELIAEVLGVVKGIAREQARTAALSERANGTTNDQIHRWNARKQALVDFALQSRVSNGEEIDGPTLEDESPLGKYALVDGKFMGQILGVTTYPNGRMFSVQDRGGERLHVPAEDVTVSDVPF
jgi:hypothetical protein